MWLLCRVSLCCNSNTNLKIPKIFLVECSLSFPDNGVDIVAVKHLQKDYNFNMIFHYYGSETALSNVVYGFMAYSGSLVFPYALKSLKHLLFDPKTALFRNVVLFSRGTD